MDSQPDRVRRHQQLERCILLIGFRILSSRRASACVTHRERGEFSTQFVSDGPRATTEPVSTPSRDGTTG